MRAGCQEGAGQGPGQELPVREHQHAGAEAAQQVRGQRLLGVGTAADRRAQQAAGPDSAAATHRARGNAPSRDWFEGRPKNAAFFSLSGTSVVDPSMETTRSPQQNTPGAPSAPVGPATCSNSIRTGSAPSFPRPRDSEEIFGSHHWRPPPASTRSPGASFPASRSAPLLWWYRPSASLAITCPYPQFRPRNSHKARTKYTISRAGSKRRRCSRVPVTSTTSSTSSGGNALVSTPTETRSGSQPSGDNPSEPS